MTVHFFRYDPDAPAGPAVLLPEDMKIRCWRPDRDGYPPPRSRRISNLVWWAFAEAGRFSRPGFAEICLEREGRLLHRLIVTPAWHRFPFMAPEDLQIGDVWTSVAARRKHLARLAIAETHRLFASEQARFWYVTDAKNEPSQALARSCGYRLVAIGRRTGWAPLLGQYVIEKFV